jgi:hypothetical protein
MCCLPFSCPPAHCLSTCLCAVDVLRVSLVGAAAGAFRKHVAAYLMLVLGGNASPAAADIKNVLDAAGIASDDSDIERLLAAVDGKVCWL